MKQIFVILLFFGSITDSYSQKLNNQQIESDLYNSYQKILSLKNGEYGHEYDSLAIVNNNFKDKIEKYTSTFPTMMASKFDSLRKDSNMFIVDSEDQLMKIYSWDTRMGGSRPFFANIFQYKVGTKVFSKVAYNQPYSPNGDDNYKNFENFPFYSQIFTLEANNKIYYLGINNTIYSRKEVSQSLKIFTIDENHLNDSIALIKTENGFVNTIDFNFNFFNLSDRPERPFRLIKYDSKQKIISIPTLDIKGNLSDNLIRYQFTGPYFELLETPKNNETNEVGIGFVARKNPEFTSTNNDHIFSDSKLTEKWNSGEVFPFLEQPKSGIYHFICLEKTDNYYKILLNKTDIAYVPTSEISEIYKEEYINGKKVDNRPDGSYYFTTWDLVLSDAEVSRLTKDNPILKDLNDQSQIIENNCGYDFLFVNEVYQAKNGSYWLKISFSECEEPQKDKDEEPSEESTKMVEGWIKWRIENKLLIAISFLNLQC